MKNGIDLTIGQRITYVSAANTLDCKHAELNLSGDVIKSEFDGELAFRPDPAHHPALCRLGFDEESMAYDGLGLDWGKVFAA